jgi:hypothetical protein
MLVKLTKEGALKGKETDDAIKVDSPICVTCRQLLLLLLLLLLSVVIPFRR